MQGQEILAKWTVDGVLVTTTYPKNTPDSIIAGDFAVYQNNLVKIRMACGQSPERSALKQVSQSIDRSQ